MYAPKPAQEIPALLNRSLLGSEKLIPNFSGSPGSVGAGAGALQAARNASTVASTTNPVPPRANFFIGYYLLADSVPILSKLCYIEQTALLFNAPPGIHQP